MYAIEQVAYLADQKFQSLVKKMSRRVPNRADAEDIVQTAFERAIRYADKCKDGDFPQWFNTILNNSWKDWSKESRLAGMTEEVTERNGGFIPHGGEQKELSQLLHAEINRIRQPFKRDVVYRRFCMGLPVTDIAKLLEVDRERVKKCLLRWRQSMYKKYGVHV